MKELPDEVWETPDQPAWEAPFMPGRVGSGLIGCVWMSAIPVAIIAAIGLLLVDGTAGLIIAGVVSFPWLLFTVGSFWQIREMRRGGRLYPYPTASMAPKLTPA